jgi:hypothetical protein
MTNPTMNKEQACLVINRFVEEILFTCLDSRYYAINEDLTVQIASALL